MTSHEPLESGPHLSAGRITSYAAGTVDAAGRVEVEAHLADCEECRTELIEVSRLAREGKTFPWQVVIPLAAAAGMVGILLLDSSGSRTAADDRPVVRSSETVDGSAGITVVRPAPGTTPDNGLVLAWGRVPDASVYRVTVSDERGDSVWAGTTTDTTLVLTRGAIPHSARRHFWYVDALLKDGRTVSSGLQEFRSGP